MQIFEINKSQSGEIARNAKNSFDRTFCVIAELTDSFNAVQAAVRALLPDSEANMVLTSVSPREEDRNEEQRFWTVQARYRDPEHPDAREVKETGEYEESFSTTGGQVTRTHAKSQVYYDDASGEAKTDESLAIGWDGQRANGTEVTIPVYRFQETHYLPDAVVTEQYRLDLGKATGAVNSADFRGLFAGECLFLGAEGSRRQGGDWPITYYFDGSQNLTGFKGAIKYRKLGQQHLWIKDRLELTPNAAAPVPDRVYVADIAEFTRDFNDFVPAKN